MSDNFLDFINSVKKGMNERGYISKIEKINKGNGITLSGITFYRETTCVSPIIYLEEFYQMYLEKLPMTEILTKIENIFAEQSKKCDNLEKLLNFNFVKRKVFPCLVRKTGNSLLTDEIVSNEWHDLAVVFQIMFQDEKASDLSVLISKHLLEMWPITENELKNIAMENLKKCQMHFCSLEEKLSDMLSDMLIFENNFENKKAVAEANVCLPIYVMTNESSYYGASMILDKKNLELITRLLGRDFYLIPSSIHEMLCVPVNSGLDKDFLKNLLAKVNQTKVSPEEILEWHLYRYHADKKELTYP